MDRDAAELCLPPLALSFIYIHHLSSNGNFESDKVSYKR